MAGWLPGRRGMPAPRGGCLPAQRMPPHPRAGATTQGPVLPRSADVPPAGYEHRLLMNYNDKPLLTRPQQRFYTGVLLRLLRTRRS